MPKKIVEYDADIFHGEEYVRFRAGKGGVGDCRVTDGFVRQYSDGTRPFCESCYVVQRAERGENWSVVWVNKAAYRTKLSAIHYFLELKEE